MSAKSISGFLVIGSLLFMLNAHASTPVAVGQRVTAKTESGSVFTVYLTGPMSSGLGILLSSDRRGMTAKTYQWADRLGSEGYRVAVTDIYKGKVYSSQHRAQDASKSVDSPAVRDEFRATLHLLAAPGRKLITMGWGPFGGKESLLAALADPALVSATIIYHDPEDLILDSGRLGYLKGAVLGIFFSDDQHTRTLQLFEAAMRRAKKPLYVHFYPGRVDRASLMGMNGARSDAAQLAWTETTGFIRDVQRYCRRCAGYYYRRWRR